MAECHDQDMAFTNNIVSRIRETREQNPADYFATENERPSGRRFRDHIDHTIRFGQEVLPEALAFTFVPIGCRMEFNLGFIVDKEFHLYLARRRSAIRAREACQELKASGLLWLSWRRRSTSASQADSVLSSAGASRLAMRCFAMSARSLGGSCRAWESTVLVDIVDV